MTKQTCASKSKVALNAAFAAILAVGLSVPAASAFAAPSDDKQAEAQAALQSSISIRASLIRLLLIMKLLIRSRSMPRIV